MTTGLLEQAELVWARYFWESWQAGEWGKLPAEDRIYGQRYLVEHLDQAKFPNSVLYSMLGQDWLRTWEEVDSTSQGFLDDVARIWQRARAPLYILSDSMKPGSFLPASEAGNLAVQVRCALCISGAVSRTVELPPELIALAVKYAVLTPTEGVVILRHITDARQRVETLVPLAPGLSDAALEAAFNLVIEIEDEWERAHGLVTLLPYLPASSVERTFRAVVAIKNQSARARALTSLCMFLPFAVYPDLLQAIQELRTEEQRGMIYISLAGCLAKQTTRSARKTLSDLLGKVIAFEGDWDKGRTLAGMAPHVPRRWLTRVVQALGGIKLEEARVEALGLLGPVLPRSLQAQLLETARDITNPYRRSEAFAMLAKNLPPGLLRRVLHVVEAENDWNIWEVLQALPNRLPRSIRSMAFHLAQEIGNPALRAQALAALLPGLSIRHRKEIISRYLNTTELARREAPDVLKNETFIVGVAALCFLPSDRYISILPGLISGINKLSDETAAINALIRLAPSIHFSDVKSLLKVVRGLNSENQARVLVKLALALRYPANQIAKEAILTWPEADVRFEALLGFLPHSTLMERSIVLETACHTLPALREHFMAGLQSPRADALTRLASQLEAEHWEFACAVAAEIKYEPSRAKAWQGLAPCLPYQWLRYALDQVGTFDDLQLRSQVLTSLAAHLPAEEAPDVLRDALRAARYTDNSFSQATAAIGMLAYLPTSSKREVVAMIETIKDAKARVQLLTRALNFLPLPEQKNVCKATLLAMTTIDDLVYRADALVELAPYLMHGLYNRYLKIALHLPNEDRLRNNPRARVLIAALPHLSFQRRLGLAEITLEAVLQIQDTDKRIEALTTLAAYLPPSLLRYVFREVSKFEDHDGRGRALARLAPYLPSDLLVLALKGVEAIGVSAYYEPNSPQALFMDLNETRCQALIDLLPFLARKERSKVLRTTLKLARKLPEQGTFDSPRAIQLARLLPYLRKAERAKVTREVALSVSQLPVLGPHGTQMRADTLTRIAKAQPTDLHNSLIKEIYANFRTDWQEIEVEKGPVDLLRIEPTEKLMQRFERVRKREGSGDQLLILDHLLDVLPAEIFPAGVELMIDISLSFLHDILRLKYQHSTDEERKSQDRRKPLPFIMKRLDQMLKQDPHRSYRMWSDFLRRLSFFPLPVTLDYLAQLSPFGMRLLDAQEVPFVSQEILSTIQEVPTWWI